MRSGAFSIWLIVLGVGSLILQTGSGATGMQPGPAGGAGGVIRGHVDVRRPLPPPDRRPTVSDLGMPTSHDAIDRTLSVVYLDTAPARAFDQGAPVRITMDQRNETFVPHVLAITTGTTVDFRNSDHTYHNVFSLSRPQRFDLGRYPTGRSRAVRFDRPGVVRVFCEIHSHMSAFILVFAHRYFSVTGVGGLYQIRGVPSGRYTLIAWNEGVERESRPLTVPDGEGIVEADFSLR